MLITAMLVQLIVVMVNNGWIIELPIFGRNMPALWLNDWSHMNRRSDDGNIWHVIIPFTLTIYTRMSHLQSIFSCSSTVVIRTGDLGVRQAPTTGQLIPNAMNFFLARPTVNQSRVESPLDPAREDRKFWYFAKKRRLQANLIFRYIPTHTASLHSCHGNSNWRGAGFAVTRWIG